MDFSLVTSTFETLRIAPPSRLILLEARTLSSAHIPPYPPDMPVLFTNLDSNGLISTEDRVVDNLSRRASGVYC
jgi:hypothetical protein